MALNFVVNTIFGAKDEHTKAFNQMGKAATIFGNKSERAFKRANTGAREFGSIVKGILAAGAIQKVFGGLSTALISVTSQFIDFDTALTAASAKFKGLDLTTTSGQETLEKLKKTAREVGAVTKFSAVEAAGGLDFYATAGFTAEQSMAALLPTAKLATIANLDLARTSDIASDSLGAFGLMTQDTAQLQKNFTRLNDVMAKTMTSTNVNMEDMFEAVKKGAPTFTATGQSIENFNALMGIMANSGVKGAEAGTQLRNIMLQLSKPTGEAQKQMEALGIKTQDSKGNFLDVVNILGQFENRLKKLGTAQKAAALKTIFGARSVTGLNLLLQEGTENIKKFRDQLKSAGGTSDKMAKIMDKSLGNRLASLKSALIEVGFSFISSFEKSGGRAIDFITEQIRKVDLGPMAETMKSVASRMFEIGEQTGVFRELRDLGNELAPLYKAFGNSMIDIVTTLDELKVFDAIAFTLKAIVFMMRETIKMGKQMAIVFKPLEMAFQSGLGGIRTILGQKTVQPERAAPQRVDVNTRQSVDIGGTLNINGAPPGSTFEQNKGAPPIDVTGLNWAGGM